MSGRTVILTHEHADFDAIASLLGASLLFSEAQPVLPHKIKRNVAGFLSLYLNQFPFVEPRHLPRGCVERAVLVDTRSYNAVKGMDESTDFLVVDHHSAAHPLPPGWAVWQESLGPHTTGANATLFVERLMHQNRRLSSLTSTLLALGIYEDTGSLLYASTTHRDIRCAAWLVEQGARLEVVRRYLHYPPTLAQQELTAQLTESAEHLTIAGRNIVFAVAEAHKYEDELSGPTQVLMDLFDPDALFLIVDMGPHIQVVARSSTDAVDVGMVAERLGGGGHGRAAAALLQGTTLAEVRRRIVDLIQEDASPPATVSQIMSRGRPHTLDEEMPVGEAMDLMKRYGHEGFPVLRKGGIGRGQLAGILTRRDADRALNHRLGTLPVQKIMRQGSHAIGADAPVGELHRLMVESGWGQIPVVDEAGALTGIVTRTDLLKLWGEEGEAQAQIPDVSRELEQALTESQHRLLGMVGGTAAEMGYAVYIVGGFVRDLILDRANTGRKSSSIDMDLVVEGDAILLAEQIQANCGGRLVTHGRFGTAKWILDESEYPLNWGDLQSPGQEGGQEGLPAHFDFVTARTEFYTEPTVLPTVEQGSIKLDLHRRDFTINTLAIALTPDRWGDLLDFYGGLTDLRTGQVRVLHSLSFVDDPTRILRAVRYEQRFGFSIETRTEEHLLDAVPLLERVTAARFRQELDRIFQEARPEEAILRLDELGVLKQIHSDLRAGAAFARNCAALRTRLTAMHQFSDQMEACESGFYSDEGREKVEAAATARVAHMASGESGLEAPIERLYWGVLIYDLLPSELEIDRSPSDVELALSDRFRLRGETRRLTRQLQQLKMSLPLLAGKKTVPSTVVHILDQAQPAARLLLSILEVDPILRERLLCYAQTWRHVSPSMDGKDLEKLGLKPGPLYGEILRRLRAALIDGDVQAGAAEWEFAKGIVSEKLEKSFE